MRILTVRITQAFILPKYSAQNLVNGQTSYDKPQYKDGGYPLNTTATYKLIEDIGEMVIHSVTAREREMYHTVATYTPALEFFFLPYWYIISQSSFIKLFQLAQLDKNRDACSAKNW